MSYTQAMFFHNNNCCYINTCDVLLYQYIVKNYKQEEKIPDDIYMNLLSDYIKLWVKYVDTQPHITNVMLVDKVNNLDIASTCNIIIDNNMKRYVHNDIKLDYNMIYKQYLVDNNFFDTDYDEDEIDYTEKKCIARKKPYFDFELTKWPNYNMDDLREKPNKDKNFNYDKWKEEVKLANIKEDNRRLEINAKLKNKYGEKYISKEFLASKLKDAKMKTDFYWAALKILSNKKKTSFFANKLATQQYRAYRYTGDNYHVCPYRYNVIYVKKEEYRVDGTYAFEEKELRFMNIVNEHMFGVKSYQVIVDDGNDYYSSHVHDIKIEYMNINVNDIDMDTYYELITEVINT